MMDGWFEAKERGRYPILGAVDERGELAGFASYGPFRGWPAYKYSVEHSLYIAATHRRQGVGTLLLGALIERARSQNYHNLVAGIDADNAVSIALHRRFGFAPCGTVRHAGFKFNRWLDLQFYQLLLDTPAYPVDG
jgi:phosphinothricin acetyltransferase